MEQKNTMPDAVILCGGLGSRLRPVVSDKPKVLADVGGKPFLDFLLNSLFEKNFSRIILAAGYLSNQLVEHYRDDPRILFSLETSPLGTGGALKNAEPLITTDHVFVANGDSMIKFDYQEAFQFHKEKGGAISLVVTRSDGRDDVGSVVCDESMRVVSFSEKNNSFPAEKRFVNCGAYFMDRRALEYLPAEKPISLEHDIFPAVARDGLCWGFLTDGHLLDIGTPDRYESAGNYLET